MPTETIVAPPPPTVADLRAKAEHLGWVLSNRVTWYLAAIGTVCEEGALADLRAANEAYDGAATMWMQKAVNGA